MPSGEQAVVAPLLDGLEAVVRALISELAADDSDLPKRLARVAGADIRKRTIDLKDQAARDVMLLVASRVCGLPFGSLAGQ
jgi:hypothetical protein